MEFMGKKLENLVVTLPIVMYIEDDLEYVIAAQYFSNLLSKNNA